MPAKPCANPLEQEWKQAQIDGNANSTIDDE